MRKVYREENNIKWVNKGLYERFRVGQIPNFRREIVKRKNVNREILLVTLNFKVAVKTTSTIWDL